MKRTLITGIAAWMIWSAPSFAQQPAPPAAGKQPAPAAPASATVNPAPPTATPASPTAIAAPPRAATPVVPAGVVTPTDYVIGPDDVLMVIFWREQDLSSEVAVRPDGKISLPLLNEIQASGLTPEELRNNLTKAANRYVEDPAVTIVVKAINSRKVFITGEVAKPGPYPLSGPTTVLQMIATAGGVLEYAKEDRIVVMRTENGRTVSRRFNYKQVSEGKNLQQNIELKPGDTIVVP
jgi:polysaccharide biosynthesis/export protein